MTVDFSGPKDKYGRPMKCADGTSIQYRQDDPIPPQTAGATTQGGGGDARIFTNFFSPAVQVMGLGPDWSREIGPVVKVPGSDLVAFTINKPWTSSVLELYHVIKTPTGPDWVYAYSMQIEGWGTRAMAAGDIDGDGKTD